MMNYSLLTIVDNQEESLKISSLLKSKGVGAYSSQAIEYGYNKWGVYVEGQKLATAQNLLATFMKSDASAHIQGPGMNYGNSSAAPYPAHSTGNTYHLSPSASNPSPSPSPNPSPKPSISKIALWVCAVVFFVAATAFVGYKIYQKDKKVDRYETTRNDSYDDDYDDDFDHHDKSSSTGYSVEEGSYDRLSLSEFQIIVDEAKKDLPIALGDGLSCINISLQGSNIYYDYELDKGYVYLDETVTEEQKREIAKKLCDDYSPLKDAYGDDVFDQMERLGVSINYRYYQHGHSKPYKTVRIPASYIKQFDK